MLHVPARTATTCAQRLDRGDRAPRAAVRRGRPRRVRRQRRRPGRPGAPASRSGSPASRCAAGRCSTGCSRRPGWRGVMAYTLAEAIWLVRTGVTDDVLVAYPTADRAALRRAGRRPGPGRRGHPDGRLRRAARPGRRGRRRRAARRRCGSASTWTPPGGRRRRCTSACAARRCTRRPRPARWPATSPAGPGFRLVGLMSYEAQIAGLGDAPPGQAAARARRSGRCSAGRTASCCAAGRPRSPPSASTPTSSSSTAAAPAASPRPPPTRRSPRSPPAPGLYGPTLFDAYRALAADAGRVLRAVGGPPARRRASRPCSAAAGSPPARPSRSRLPRPWLPAGLRLIGTRGRRRGADAAGRRRPRTRCGSATGCGSGTPRPASCASTSTSCTWSPATRCDTGPDVPGRGSCVPLARRAAADAVEHVPAQRAARDARVVEVVSRIAWSSRAARMTARERTLARPSVREDLVEPGGAEAVGQPRLAPPRSRSRDPRRRGPAASRPPRRRERHASRGMPAR